MQLTTAETQLLVALAMLEGAGRATDTDALAAYGLDHFGMYLADWAGAHEALIAQGLVERREDGYALTPEGKVVADRLRAAHPRHLYFYNEYFTRALTSAAHARFCERVYGRDLCQHGMMDMEQLGKLIEVLQLGPASRVLELGCGNGRVAEYISDTTGAHIIGAGHLPRGHRAGAGEDGGQARPARFRAGRHGAGRLSAAVVGHHHCGGRHRLCPRHGRTADAPG